MSSYWSAPSPWVLHSECREIQQSCCLIHLIRQNQQIAPQLQSLPICARRKDIIDQLVDCNLSCVKQPGPQLLKKLSKFLSSKAGKLLLKLRGCALSFPYQDPEGTGLTAQQRGRWHLAQGKVPAPRTQNFSPPGDNMLWLFRAPTGVRPVFSSVQHFACFLVSSPRGEDSPLGIFSILCYLHTSIPQNMMLCW